MLSLKLKEKAHIIVEIARAQGMITNYKDWCETDEAKEYALDEQSVKYYNKYNGGR